MDASENPRGRSAETGGVKMKNSGNDADQQDWNIPPPLETSHELSLRVTRLRHELASRYSSLVTIVQGSPLFQTPFSL